MRDLGIYIHIPFCVRKCSYCDFLSFGGREELIPNYIDALIKETEARLKELAPVRIVSVFFGGGTPSLLPAYAYARIMDTLRAQAAFAEDAEITIEANPGTVDLEKLSAYKSAGINRISFGVQSACDKELALLGRIHRFEEAKAAVAYAREAGFENINMDMMFGLPMQTLKSLDRTIDEFLALRPAHISAYSLIIEEGTPFYELYGEAGDDGGKAERQNCAVIQPLPGEDAEDEMYLLIKRRLEDNGFHQYEISNYAKEGCESRHNKLYWQRAEYLGLGLGASSLIDNVRLRNTPDMDTYLSSPLVREEESRLNKNEQMSEFVFLGLRMMEGISSSLFFETFSKTFEDTFAEQIEKYREMGLLIREGDSYRLSERGIRVSNVILADFLL